MMTQSLTNEEYYRLQEIVAALRKAGEQTSLRWRLESLLDEESARLHRLSEKQTP